MRKRILRSRRSEKLVGISSSFMRNRNRFPSPDQLAAAAAEALPPANRILRRCPIRGCVPTLHRLHRDPVADFEWTAFERPAQRRFRSGQDLSIARHLQVESPQVILKVRNIFQAPDANDCYRAHAALRRPGKPNTASPPSNARPTRTMQLTE